MTGPAVGTKPSLWFVLAALGGAAGVFVLAVLIGYLTGADSGSAADWVAALIAVALFAATVVVGWFAYAHLTVEVGRDAHRDQQEREAQARQISAWCLIELTQHISDRWTDGQYSRTLGPTVVAHLPATIENQSDKPVGEFWLQIYLPSTDATGKELIVDHWVGTLLPGEKRLINLVNPARPITTMDRPDYPMMDPAAPASIALAAGLAARGIQPHENPRFGYGWSFRDHAGVEWVHGSDGRLSEGPRPGPSG